MDLFLGLQRQNFHNLFKNTNCFVIKENVKISLFVCFWYISLSMIKNQIPIFGNVSQVEVINKELLKFKWHIKGNRNGTLTRDPSVKTPYMLTKERSLGWLKCYYIFTWSKFQTRDLNRRYLEEANSWSNSSVTQMSLMRLALFYCTAI